MSLDLDGDSLQETWAGIGFQNVLLFSAAYFVVGGRESHIEASMVLSITSLRKT